MEIRMASADQLSELTELVLQLWPDHDPGEMRSELARHFAEGNGAYYLAWENGGPVGFAQCQLRRDYVEGTESSPVGYLEGIYVQPEYRHRGYARELLSACEKWARERNCREFASDCELVNLESLRFHLAVGFLEANRIICFTKEL
jgi:aminoglycoside 6'-N-acetyltransferase I